MPIRFFPKPSQVALGLTLAASGAIACAKSAKSIQIAAKKYKAEVGDIFNKAMTAATNINHESLTSIGLGYHAGRHK